MSNLTVYYIVGLPRSGSTFVGDWIARQLGGVNAGEVWQTFRAVELVRCPQFQAGDGYWAEPNRKAAKREQIKQSEFWTSIIDAASHHNDPYSALVERAGAQSQVLVDCSKVDNGIADYERLGCKVIVVHTLRSFSTWSASMKKYQAKLALPRRNSLRLFLTYLRMNWAYLSRWKGSTAYHLARQHRLGHLEEELPHIQANEAAQSTYERHEMFGTPGFRPDYQQARAEPSLTVLDRLLLRLLAGRP